MMPNYVSDEEAWTSILIKTTDPRRLPDWAQDPPHYKSVVKAAAVKMIRERDSLEAYS